MIWVVGITDEMKRVSIVAGIVMFILGSLSSLFWDSTRRQCIDLAHDNNAGVSTKTSAPLVWKAARFLNIDPASQPSSQEFAQRFATKVLKWWSASLFFAFVGTALMLQARPKRGILNGMMITGQILSIVVACGWLGIYLWISLRSSPFPT